MCKGVTCSTVVDVPFCPASLRLLAAWMTSQAQLVGACREMPLPSRLVVGVDVGTGSARAGVFTLEGSLVHVASCLIKIYRPDGYPLLYQQSSENIWEAVSSSIKEAVAGTASSFGVTEEEVRGAISAVGFDATCSLVVLGEEDRPIPVSPADDEDGTDDYNIVMWLDHRAVKQAQAINDTRHPVLQYVGGRVSPEMEMPKLRWIKEQLPRTWSRMRQAFDLADWLGYRATGKAVRSLCTVTCKWNYCQGWDRSYLEAIGLSDLTDEQIGTTVLAPGEVIGPLTAAAAAELGLRPETVVAVGLIDAHAGGVGCVGAALEDGDNDMEARLALVCGTSTCHMASSLQQVFVPGIWGPFLSAMVPGLWLHEAGQSATGALLEHILTSHPAYHELKELAFEVGQHPASMLQGVITTMASKEQLSERHSALLTRGLHVLPHHAGCRSPLADPELRGVVVGLGLDTSIESLALQYLATVQALAYGTKHIIDALEQAGHPPISAIYVSGGLSKSPLFVREHADVLGRKLILPREKEGVLLGSAILAATASGAYASVEAAMAAMSAVGTVVLPTTDEALRRYHAKKEKVFHAMTQDQYKYKREMEEEAGLI